MARADVTPKAPAGQPLELYYLFDLPNAGILGPIELLNERYSYGGAAPSVSDAN